MAFQTLTRRGRPRNSGEMRRGSNLGHGAEEVEGGRQRHTLEDLLPLLAAEPPGEALDDGVGQEIALQAVVAEQAHPSLQIHAIGGLL